ncbi:MAG: beta-ketoacyl-ACP synthase II [Bacillota bacterium]|jgi:3-oxoacyl-[acyl-carrier-protein] synthase II
MKRRVVVTGLGAVTPVGNDVPSTWTALLQGQSGVTRITRFDATDFPVQIAAEVKGFRPEEHMDPREARHTDRFTIYAVAAAQEAWKHAGLQQDELDPQRVGVIIGSGIGGMETLEKQHQNYLERGPRRISPFFVPMLIGNMAAGQVSIALGAQGPVSAVVTACATGTSAIGEAFRTIARGDADIVVAGGTEAAITPMALGGFCAARALSTRNADPAGASRPFDQGRDGFVMGEGSGVVILESLECAEKRGATILAEVVGYGQAGDAFHVVQPHPEAAGAAAAMARALHDAGWQPEEVDYINAHGTSTSLNDRLETKAIKQVFGQHAYRLAVNSTKSMTGHMLGAAGALEFIVVVQSMLSGTLHPTINLTEPDPDCDLDYVPNVARRQQIDKALSNSLGFGGHNATLAIARWEEQ